MVQLKQCGIMKVIIFITLILFQRCNAQSPKGSTQSYMEIGPRIVSGYPANYRNHRHLVYIVANQHVIYNERNRIRTGVGHGSLLTLKWALTAAHVVDKPAMESIFVFAGMLRKSDLDGWSQNVQVQVVCQRVLHPLYKLVPGGAINDLAMLKFRAAFRNTVWVRAIGPNAILDYTNNELDIYRMFQNKKCVAAGFGLINDPRVSVDQLQEASLRLVPPRRCYDAGFIDYPTHAFLCTFDNSSATYRGDSGTPLICEKCLAGVLSYGMSNTSVPKSQRINVFTRADYWKGWILDVIWEYETIGPNGR